MSVNRIPFPVACVAAAIFVLSSAGAHAASVTYRATVQGAKDMRVVVQGRTLADGQTVRLDAGKGIVVEGLTYGKRRLYCVDPWTHGNVGPNIVIERHGIDGMSYSINTGSFSGRGDWTIEKEKYAISPGQARAADGKVADITPPADGSAFSVKVSGETTWKFVRVAPGGKHEEKETESGSATVRFEPFSGPVSVGDFSKILALYNSRIPKGLVGGGIRNNLLSWWDNKYKDYACGAYQAKVLALLDSLRHSSDPAERALIEGYDYGPIEAYYGGHQAVVIYPSGTSWVDTGTILDPWPNQKPETWTVEQWADRFSIGTMHGIGGSSAYSDQANPGYPTVGGTYVDPNKTKPLTAAENAALQRLPADQQAKLKKIKDAANRRYLARRLIAEMNKTGDRVMAHSPVHLYIVDAQGRRAGFPGGVPTNQIPGVEIRAYPLDDGTRWTEIEFSRQAGQQLVVEGTGAGTATILDGRGIGQGVGDVVTYRIDANKGAQGTLDLGQRATALSLDGSAVSGRSAASADDALSAAPPPPTTSQPTAPSPQPTTQPTVPAPQPFPSAQPAPPAPPAQGGWVPIIQ